MCSVSWPVTNNVGNYADTLWSIEHNFLKTWGGKFQYGHYAYIIAINYQRVN